MSVDVGKDGSNNLKLTYLNGKLVSVSHTEGPFGVSFDDNRNVTGTLTLGTATTGYLTLGAPIFGPDMTFSLEITSPVMGTPISTGIELNFRPGGFTGLGIATFGIGAEAMGVFLPTINYAY